MHDRYENELVDRKEEAWKDIMRFSRRSYPG
jgi:hypothetical protein